MDHPRSADEGEARSSGPTSPREPWAMLPDEGGRREGTGLVFSNTRGKPLSDKRLSTLINELGIAAGGFARPARLPRPGSRRNAARALDDFANPPVDRCGDAPPGLHRDPASAGNRRSEGARRSALMPRPWRRTPPCGASCDATRARPIRSFSRGSRRHRASPRRRGRIWRGWIGPARRRAATPTGGIRTTPTRASRR